MLLNLSQITIRKCRLFKCLTPGHYKVSVPVEENPWLYDAKIWLQILFVLSCEEVAGFWDPRFSMVWDVFNSVNSWNWPCIWPNFVHLTNISQKNYRNSRDILRICWVYPSWAVGYTRAVIEVGDKMNANQKLYQLDISKLILLQF